MKLIEMKCKNCGAKLKVNPEKKEAHCEFCGVDFKKDDEVHHIKYDDMEQSGYEFEKGKIRAREESEQKKIQEQNEILQAHYQEEKRKKNLVWWIIGWIFFFPIPLTVLIWKSKWDQKKKIIATIILWIGLLIIGAFSPSDTTNTQTNNSTNNEQSEIDTIRDNNNDYVDALRKCTVMEASDIYTTGVGQKTDNVFDDAKVTCESFKETLGEEDFISTVEEDWKNRQSEQIEGKPLSYYLDILGW